MADSAMGLDRNFDPVPYSAPISADRVPADFNPRVATPDAGQIADVDLGSLIRLATTKQQSGDDAEAEHYFLKALQLADKTLGSAHPEMMLLLTDLTRFYLKKSAFASAEPHLLRLLELKRAKGDDHPEVATVLASLATVRQALGSHESAEQLWRRVLSIREQTLAPNHFAIATALEHLGQSCAARGKIAEGLEAFQRALSIRERTLGVDHASLRVSRERIADLELQDSESFLDLIPEAAPRISPEKYRLTSGEPRVTPLPTLIEREAGPSIVNREPVPAPVTREKKAAPPPPATPKKQAVILPGPFAESALRLETTDTEANLAPPTFADLAGFETAVHSEPVAYRAALESLRDEFEAPYEETPARRSTAEIFASVVAVASRKHVMAGAVVVGMSLLFLAAVTDSGASGETQKTTSGSPVVTESPRIAPAVGVSNTNFPAREPLSLADNTITAKATLAKTHPTEDRSSRTTKPAEKKTESKPETKFAVPTLSGGILSRLDSVASTAGKADSRVADMFTPAPAQINARRFEDDQNGAPTRARLIGDLPTPRVPSQVADVEGEVRVRFNVDANGQPMMSTFSVVNSPNPLLTAAVRKVIPEMRFEPARTAGPDGKAITDVVQVGFQFSRRE